MLWLVIALILFIFQIATVLVLEFRRPSKTVAWLMVLFVIPLVGFVMYYFMAKEYTHRKKLRRKSVKALGELRRDFVRISRAIISSDAAHKSGFVYEPRLFALLNNIPGSPFTRNNEVEVLTNAKPAYKAMLQAIREATSHIHLEFYTVRHDKIGMKFQKLLIQKAREGVAVRCIFDGIGSYKLSSRYIQELQQAGVQVHIFLRPLIAFFDKRMNYRNHRKILVVDGLIGFLGGINIGDEYLGEDPKLGFWRDTHLALRGDSVYYLQHTFITDWLFVSGEKLSDSELFPEHDLTSRNYVQIITSGPDAHWDSILEMYFGSITTAKKRIWIATPYFIPDPSIMMGLKTAAISGVDVRIVYPQKPDSRIVGYASLSYLEELMQAGVQFYSYQNGFIHAKVVLIDDLLASVGTANMDMRSFFSNFELNAVVYDKDTLRRLESDFKEDMKNSRKLKLEEFEQRSRTQKALEVLARLFSPLF
ncbi:cardiolipin synthase [Paenibacillus thalictri]|uniref:Cardiolipin synthase n=1 Tax=Paenibacillus thalictri TaxID=2527873 RepID=A0A4V2J4D5_9BACL|nr:cardiolipin synthase [Paenibacillus thalictri]TBL78691.1 cardiolipin synthase [Paenibacillus thalictri]